MGREVNSPPSVDRIWLWAYYNKILLYPIFYLLVLKGTIVIRTVADGACRVWGAGVEMEGTKKPKS